MGFPLSLFAIRLSAIEAVTMGFGVGLVACKRPDLIGEILEVLMGCRVTRTQRSHGLLS
jgi:hypothetical protein